MLGKLIKYEFMATGRVFLPLFAALLIVSAINRLFQNLNLEVPAVIGVILSVILIVGILVLTLILTLQRFQKNLMSNEGYLMMTLPVRPDSLILSKLFVASVWTAASTIIVTVSIMIMAMSGISISEILAQIRLFFEQIAIPAPQVVVYAIELIVLIVLSLFSGILLLYACMALSMLVNKRRWLFTFGAYIVITTAMQTILAVLVALGASFRIYDLLSINSMSDFGQIQIVILLVLVAEAAMCVVFYYITRHMLKNRLNLQ